MAKLHTQILQTQGNQQKYPSLHGRGTAILLVHSVVRFKYSETTVQENTVSETKKPLGCQQKTNFQLLPSKET